MLAEQSEGTGLLSESAPGVNPLNALVVLAGRRLVLAPDVAAAKFVVGGRIDDLVREQEILERVARELSAAGSEPEAGVAFFGDQIEANKVIQRGLHHHWRANPADFPAHWRSLADEIRPQLDVINQRMLLLLPQVGQLPPRQLGEVTELLDAELAASLPLKRLVHLRRVAACVASRSLRQGHETA
ncbi:MAG TPA: gamma subclass chorismate mutase AroQ [Trebonia sp.]